MYLDLTIIKCFLDDQVERVAADDLKDLLLVLDRDDADHQLQLAGHQPL